MTSSSDGRGLSRPRTSCGSNRSFSRSRAAFLAQPSTLAFVAAASSPVSPAKDAARPSQAAALLEHREVHSREAVAHVSFLVEEYEPRCYLFSVFECLRRIAMTGGLTIFADGGALQIAAGLFVAIVSHRVYSAYEPYISDDDDVLSEVAQTQLVIIFFYAMMAYATENLEEKDGVFSGEIFGFLLVESFCNYRKGNIQHLVPENQGRPGTARHGGPADLWLGPARKILARKILARHGTENLGTEKYWHGVARKKIS